MKVSIWGSYNFGNYGDDLMALQFAITLKKMGISPCVYRLNRRIAEKYLISTTNSLEELFHGAKFCIIGGGAMLAEYPRDADVMENDFRELYLVSNKYQCPVFPISVGGNGKGVNTLLSLWRKEFWSSPYCQTSTVRLQEDVALVKKLGKEAIYYPDVLLSIADFWEIEPLPKYSNQLQVGINIGKSLRQNFLAFQLSLIAEMRKDVVFHFIRTHLPDSSSNYEFLPKQESSYIKHHVYSDPLSTLRFIKSLDLVVSSKLHLGLTALALNVPFYSYSGKDKTKAFMRSINADFAVFRRNETLKIISLLANTTNITQAKYQFDFEKLNQTKILSIGHLNFLQDVVKKIVN